MLPTNQLGPLRDVITRYGLSARKNLGQNFLLDMNLTSRIARNSEKSSYIKSDFSKGCVIEIGPGPGGLTRALLETEVRRLFVIEKDTRCHAAMEELAAVYPALELIKGDALEIDVSSLGKPPRRVVANLPYNISTVLLIKWLENINAFESLTLMFQKEVVDRLNAKPDSKQYGRLSIMTQWLCEVRPLFDVNPSAFTPPPKVTSTVVQLIPHEQPLFKADFKALEKVVEVTFGKRRKMLRASLKFFGDSEEICKKADIASNKRPENLSIKDFCSLARIIKQENYYTG